MAKERTVEICALNIAMHNPHSQERYVNLFRDAYSLKSLIQQGELHGLLLGALYAGEAWKADNLISGEIYRFVKVDADEPWFNTRTAKQATEKDVAAINIPDHLLAHLQRIPFVFLPDKHQLWFVSRDRKNSLGPLVAERFLQKLFEIVAAQKQYPTVSVTALPDAETLKNLLSMHRLQKLIIEVKRPNPDDGAAAAQRTMQRLQRLHAKKETMELIADDDGSITPDDELKSYAEVAASNGSVTGIGKNAEGLPERESTAQKPMRIFTKVDEAIETLWMVLKRQARGQ